MLNNLSESISQVEEQIPIAEKQILILESKLNILEQQISNVNNSIRAIEYDISEELTGLNIINSEINKLQSGKKYNLHDPTSGEVRLFIRRDKTDEKPYDDETFNCANYAQEVNNNAEAEGIRCAYVSLDFKHGGPLHALVAFNTTDKGIIFYEPQLDKIAYLEIGKYYWGDCVRADPGYFYMRDIEDIVDSFELVW
jgi:hypothetical protein